MKKIINTLASATLVVACMFGMVGFISGVAMAGGPAPAAVDPKGAIGGGVQGAGGGAAGSAELEGGLKRIVNILLFILGAIAVIVIVIGGIRYTLSNGDSGQIKQAKDTILYAVVGLIVAILAYAIVNFVLGQF